MSVQAYQFEVSVRPYTLRKGDTLPSIADKRGECLLFGEWANVERERASPHASLPHRPHRPAPTHLLVSMR